MPISKLTQQRLRELLTYDDGSGKFYWAIKRGHRKPGDLAGNPRKDGYVYIRIDNSLYSAHRLVFLYVNGSFPSSCVDHRNGIKSDNRMKNLRIASMQENMRNRGTQKNNTSGFKGVSFHKPTMKWKANIKVNGKSISLGYYVTPQDAHKAYCAAAEKYHGEFSNTGI